MSLGDDEVACARATGSQKFSRVGRSSTPAQSNLSVDRSRGHSRVHDMRAASLVGNGEGCSVRRSIVDEGECPCVT